jgi:hypothetical protein
MFGSPLREEISKRWVFGRAPDRWRCPLSAGGDRALVSHARALVSGLDDVAVDAHKTVKETQDECTLAAFDLSALVRGHSVAAWVGAADRQI